MSRTRTLQLSATVGIYDYSCYGPDGFQRRFAGKLFSDYNKIEAVSILNPTNGATAIALENLSTSAVTFSLTNGYTIQTASYVVPAHGTNVINLGSETNNGLYDVTVTSTADTLFIRRFLGRAEIVPIVPPIPIILSNATVASGNFQFNFTGPIGQTYKVLVTMDVADSSSWQVISSGIFGNTITTFTDPSSIGSHATRYYRVVSP
jgi:hypothetical protein